MADYKGFGTIETRTIEECSELIQAICKAQRFGWYNHHPERATNNIEETLHEITDVLNTVLGLEEYLREKIKNA